GTVDLVAPAAPVITSPTDGFLINTSSLLVSGTYTSESPDVTVKVNGVAATQNSVAGTFEITLTGLSHGALVLTAAATDAAGNTSTSAAVSGNVDLAAPAAPIITSPSNGFLINTTSLLVSGTYTSESPDVAVNVNGVAAAQNAVAGTFEVTLTGLTNGSLSLTATATDQAGNTSTSSAVSGTVDLVAPAAPVITSPSNGFLTDATLTVSGTYTSETPDITVTVNGAAVTQNAGLNTWSVDLTGLATGPLVLTARATDAAGNFTDSTSVSGTVDATPPSVSTSPAMGQRVFSRFPTLQAVFWDNVSLPADITAEFTVDSTIVNNTQIQRIEYPPSTDYPNGRLVLLYYAPTEFSCGYHTFEVEGWDRLGNGRSSGTIWYNVYCSGTGGSGSGCFLAGTMITMADGTYKPIENVREGEWVLSYDFEKQKNTAAVVAKAIVHEKNEGGYLEINGIRLTPNHPLWINDTWQEADKAKEGDLLLRSNGIKEPIKEIKRFTGDPTVYNFEIAGTHVFYAKDVLGHNAVAPDIRFRTK
ncbi:MAG: hypothetical protein HY587_04860, partial [Candidatus Omnitrophica bacterium]|nr:hypothetical protein [Candidatus Omnitrophota bacterium]